MYKKLQKVNNFLGKNKKRRLKWRKMDPVRPTELIDGPSLVQIDPQREPHVLERIGDKGVETKLLIDSY